MEKYRNAACRLCYGLRRDREQALESATLYPNLRSPIFSVKQPAQSLVSYISDRSTSRVYLSYPISEPIRALRDRADPSLIDQINHFRRFFAGAVVAFDPITINERPIQMALNDFKLREKEERRKIMDDIDGWIRDTLACVATGDRESASSLLQNLHRSCLALNSELQDRDIELRLGHLWPTSNQPKTISPFESPETISIKRSEIDEVITADQTKSEIDRQIRFRDLRLINQSDCIVVYRPGVSGKDWSTGTFVECKHAQDTGKAVIVLSEKNDAKPTGPFDHKLHTQDVIALDDAADEKSRAAAFAHALARVKQYSEELLKKELR